MSRPALSPKALLESLRAEGAKEYGITGMQEIGKWFCRVGYRKAPVSVRQLYRWKAELGCPFGPTDHRRGTKCWTTNLLLMAWAAGHTKRLIKRVDTRRMKRDRLRQEDILAVQEAIRRKLLTQGSAPSRVGQGTAPGQPPSS